MLKEELELKACDNLNEARRRLGDAFKRRDKEITAADIRNAANDRNAFMGNGYYGVGLKSEVLEWELYLKYLRTAAECVEQLQSIISEELWLKESGILQDCPDQLIKDVIKDAHLQNTILGHIRMKRWFWGDNSTIKNLLGMSKKEFMEIENMGPKNFKRVKEILLKAGYGEYCYRYHWLNK